MVSLFLKKAWWILAQRLVWALHVNFIWNAHSKLSTNMHLSICPDLQSWQFQQQDYGECFWLRNLTHLRAACDFSCLLPSQPQLCVNCGPHPKESKWRVKYLRCHVFQTLFFKNGSIHIYLIKYISNIFTICLWLEMDYTFCLTFK